MMKKKRFLLGSLLAAATLPLCTYAAPAIQQPKISSRQIPVLTVGDLKFRDLNRNGQLDPYEDWRLSAEARAADLVARMSLAEKAGTMLHIDLPIKNGHYDFDALRSQVLTQHINSGITRVGAPPSELARQHNKLQELAEQGRLGIPMTISSDPRGLPISHLGIGAIGDTMLAHRLGDLERQEYRALGLHMTLSPMADLATEPRWGRISGTFGEDPEQVRDLVRAYIEGFQGSAEGLTPDGVISVVKHWTGYGAAAEQGFDGHNIYGRWSGYPGDNFEQHFIPYEGAFAAKVAGVMPTYTILRDLIHEGHPMEPVGGGFNKYLLTDLLRDRYGFKGLILSDFGIIDGMPWGMESATRVERSAKTIQAGVDQIGGSPGEPGYLIEAVEQGLLTQEQMDTATQQILLLKFHLGLFETPYVSPEQAEVVIQDSRKQIAELSIEQRSLVLLKNEDSQLPLQKGPGLPQRNHPKCVYLFGIDSKVAEEKGFQVVTDAARADFAIVRLQTPREFLHLEYPFGRMLPEGNLAFAPGQPDFDAVVSLATSGLPVIATVNLGRAAVLTALLPHVQGLFGDFGISDQALLDVILGKAKPEGRLPIELPSSMAAVEAQKPDLPHDSENPLFPIRYGLSYR